MRGVGVGVSVGVILLLLVDLLMAVSLLLLLLQLLWSRLFLLKVVALVRVDSVGWPEEEGRGKRCIVDRRGID